MAGTGRPRSERKASRTADEATAAPTLRSLITCPDCGHQADEPMPTDACQFLYDCRGCGAVLRPLPGHCCVFCSYGSVPCPHVQEARRSTGSWGAAVARVTR